MGKKAVVTDKKRVSTYISEDLKNAIEKYAETKSITVSIAIAEIMEAIVSNKGRIISVNDKTWEILAKWAMEERRTSEQQAQLIIEQATERYLDTRPEDKPKDA